MMTAMTRKFRMTASANAQVEFIGTGNVAVDGTTVVLSWPSDSGRPMPASNAGGPSGPEPRHETVRAGWLEPKRSADGDCQSPGKQRTSSYPRLRQQPRAQSRLVTVH